MRKDVGVSTGLLALLALFVHTQLPHSEDASVQQTGGGGTSARKNSTTGDRTEAVEGPWLATQAFFHAASTSLPPQETDFDDSQKLSKVFPALIQALTSAEKPKDPETLRKLLRHIVGLAPGPDPSEPEMFSIVATVADPSHTHMALFFDEQTEAIERSLQERGWDFAEQWLPWIDRFDGNEPVIGARRCQRRLQREQEELPGVLVFRAAPGPNPNKDEKHFPKRVLFVFLVPETVTGGINGPAFYAAMHLAGVLSKGSNGIGLLAPSFSGSFAGLSVLIREMKPWESAPAISSPVYSGTVANLDYASLFVEEMKETGTPLSFHGGILDSKDYQEALCTVLKKYDMDTRVAVLKEDEGGLQRSILGCAKVQTYVFPREISHLRNAYQEASGVAVKDPYMDGPGRVNFSIRDPTNGEDSVPTLSETQTPLTQDTILSSITGELNRQHTHVVFISVTNPLDALFLLQALHAACPDTRVIISGPSVLFVAAAGREALDGTLFLSSYPMFFEGDDWTEGCTRSSLAAKPCEDLLPPTRLMFPESSLQGLYNVTQFLLTDLGAKGGEARLRGYRQPRESNQPARPYPGLWILTLNRFGFLPVDLISQTPSSIDGNQKETGWFKFNKDKNTALPPLDAGTAPRPWMVTVFLVSLVILLACFTFIRCNLSLHGAKPFWLVFSDGYWPRFQALLCACLSLTALEWILALPWCLPPEAICVFDRSRLVFLRVSIVLGAAAPLATVIFTLYLLRRQITIAGATLRSIVYCLIPIGLFAFAAGAWFFLCNHPGTGLFFRFRAMELYSGSSPALPLAIACLVFFSISLSHLKQYALAGLARPRLTLEPGVPATAYREKFKAAYDSIGQRATAPWTLDKSSLARRIAMAAVFGAFCVVILAESPRAFELQPYNYLLLGAIYTILVCMATKSYDLLALWRFVAKLLDLIQLLPLRSAIQRIAEDWPKRSIWAFNRSVSKESVEREMLYSLHRRVVILKEIEAELPIAMPAMAAARFGASQESLTHNGDVDFRIRGNGHPRSWAFGLLPKVPDAEEQLNSFRALVFGTPGANPAAQARLDETEKHQEHCAKVAAEIYERDLVPAWRASLNDETTKDAEVKKTSQVDDPESLHHKYVDSSADFVALQFCRFIAYAVAHVKRMATTLSLTFVLLALLFNSYSPEGSQLIARFLGALFLVIGVVVWRVFSQMERNPILSTIAHTTAGELGGEFWIQLLALGGLPLLGVLGHLFPAVSQFLFQWIAPSVQAAR
jgi:hypothetical protein